MHSSAFVRQQLATPAQGGIALLDPSQRVIMEMLNEIKFGKEPGPRNMTWVITQLRSGMDVVATVVENLSRERLTAVLYRLAVAGENPPPALFEQCDVTLRGILAVVKSKDSLPIPEEPKNSPILPLPWDAYNLAQSLHDFAEQLGRLQVRAIPGDELQRPDLG